MNTNPWIDGAVKPTRLGVYEVSFGNRSAPTRASWDGRVWRHDKLPPRGQRNVNVEWRELPAPAPSEGKS